MGWLISALRRKSDDLEWPVLKSVFTCQGLQRVESVFMNAATTCMMSWITIGILDTQGSVLGSSGLVNTIMHSPCNTKLDQHVNFML